MGRADDAVQVFQTNLVLHENDQVVVLFLKHLFVAAKAGVDGLNGVDVLFFQIRQHDLEDAGQRHGVIDRAVVVERRDLQMLVDGVQLVVAQAREQRLTHG